MPIEETNGQFNTGRDLTLVVIGPNGLNLTVPNLTGFSSHAVYAEVRSDLLNGTQLQADLPKGWVGKFECDRRDATLDTLAAFIETSWYNSGTFTGGIIYTYILNNNGSQSVFEYTNVSFKFTDAGDFKGDATVKQVMEFTADRRNQIS